jgi:beta-galactosidase
LLLNALGRNQTATLNGKILYSKASPDISRTEIMIDAAVLLEKNNLLQLTADPFVEWRDREGLFQFHPASLRLLTPAEGYKRKVFNGLAQVIVQSTGDTGVIRLRARGEGLQDAILEIPTGKNR